MNFSVSLKRAPGAGVTKQEAHGQTTYSRVGKSTSGLIGPIVMQHFATNGTKSATKRTDPKTRRAYPVHGALHSIPMTHLGKLHDPQMLGKR
jgi:hypothetical protein